MEYTYITISEPTRWDTLAQLAFGDVTKIKELIDANPGVVVTGYIPVGSVMNIPILSVAETEDNNLPPWKQ